MNETQTTREMQTRRVRERKRGGEREGRENGEKERGEKGKVQTRVREEERDEVFDSRAHITTTVSYLGLSRRLNASIIFCFLLLGVLFPPTAEQEVNSVCVYKRELIIILIIITIIMKNNY